MNIQVGDLVHGFYFHRKIGVVVKIDEKAEFAFVQYTDNKKSWEPLCNLKKVIK